MRRRHVQRPDPGRHPVRRAGVGVLHHQARPRRDAADARRVEDRGARADPLLDPLAPRSPGAHLVPSPPAEVMDGWHLGWVLGGLVTGAAVLFLVWRVYV